MRKMLLAIGLASAVLAGQAKAGSSRIVEPDWLQKPDGADIARVYPDIAQILDIEGKAMVACAVDAQGVLGDCRSEAAYPAGLGFDYAALKLTEKFRMRPRMVDGAPVNGGEIRIPIRFTLPKPAETPSRRTPAPPTNPKGLETARQAVELSRWVETYSADQEKLFWRAQRASQAGADPAILAEALSALRAARTAAYPLMAEAAARNIAASLSSEEIKQWSPIYSRLSPVRLAATPGNLPPCSSLFALGTLAGRQ